MERPRLRVYFGPDDHVLAPAPEPETVNVPLAEVLPALTDAILSRRSWLEDFRDDEVTISADLYEIILAYQQFRPSA